MMQLLKDVRTRHIWYLQRLLLL